MKNYKKLSEEKQGELDFLLMMYPRLGEPYRLKIMFNEFWDLTNPEEAMSYLTFWCDVANDTDIFPFKRFVKKVQSHWSGILNYIKARISSGIMEGINNKIQLGKRRARGYRNLTTHTIRYRTEIFEWKQKKNLIFLLKFEIIKKNA